MVRTLLRIFAAAVVLGASACAAAANSGSIPESTFVGVGTPTSVPYGWVDFCGRESVECEGPTLPAVDVSLTRASFEKLDRINRQVNALIEPVTNLEHWGTLLDHWDYPTDGKGDCKVYALYKRKLLMDIGFPRQALLMTIVRDQEGEGHAILTVRTNRGDFVLDNLADDIVGWEQTGYLFIKRQSQEDPNVWLALDPTVKMRPAADRAHRPAPRV